jgi:hypothetical protein
MGWKKVWEIILIILLIILVSLLGYYLRGSSSEEAGEEEVPSQEESGGEEGSEATGNGDEEEAEEEVDETADWVTQAIGSSLNPSYISHPSDWSYKAITGDLPGSSYEMLANDTAIQDASHALQLDQAMIVISLGPNNSYGEPFGDVIAMEKDFVQEHHPGASFEEEGNEEMATLISSYQEGDIKIRQYYLVKEKATGFFTCRYLDNSLITLFDTMIETVELNQVGTYE